MKTLAILLLTSSLFIGCSEVGTAQSQKTLPKIDPKIGSQIGERGTARVIVRLRVPIKTQEVLTEQQELAQKRSIAAAQQAILKQLANTKHRVIRQLEITPDLVLEVGPDALRLIERSADVEQVFSDELAVPLR